VIIIVRNDMKKSDAGRIMLLLMGVMSCSTLLLVLRCSGDIEQLDVRTHVYNPPVPKRHTDEAYPLQPDNVTDVGKPRDGLVLPVTTQPRISEEQVQLSVTRADNNVNITGANNRHVDMSDILWRASKAVVEPVSYNNEFEVVPFTRFAIDRMYPVEPGLGRRVVEKPIGYRKREIRHVIEHAVNSLARQTGRKFSASDFLEGIYRVVPSVGTQYELFFRDGTQYHKVMVMLPNLSPFVIGDETVSMHKDTVHIIVALSQRVDAFQQFLWRFKQLASQDSYVDLTVVYFGRTGLKKVQSLVREFNADRDADIVHLVATSGKFSRGHGLQIGADHLSNDSLLFMCDVDIVLTGSFLERCRLHTSLGHSVYYPIVFSLYNPNVIAHLHSTTRSPDRPVVARDAGFWRDFGYGMTCQYRSDFLGVGGFADEVASNGSVAGWGLEDVRLYRKHLRSGNVTVVRATDPGIFHIWHEKSCPRSLPQDQYKGCLRSRAFSEASHDQLGMLLLHYRSTQAVP